jgi:hypothetical protein
VRKIRSVRKQVGNSIPEGRTAGQVIEAMGDDPPDGPPAKRPLSRKAQLRELQRKKAERRQEAAQERADPDWLPPAEEACDDLAHGMPVEQPGAASRKENDRERKRRKYAETVRGISREAAFTQSWLATAPANEQYYLDKANLEEAQHLMRRAVAAAVKAVEEEEVAAARAEAALRKKELRRAQRDQVSTPADRNLRQRLESTDLGSTSTPSPASARSFKSPYMRHPISDSVRAVMKRIYDRRFLRREDGAYTAT